MKLGHGPVVGSNQATDSAVTVIGGTSASRHIGLQQARRPPGGGDHRDPSLHHRVTDRHGDPVAGAPHGRHRRVEAHIGAAPAAWSQHAASVRSASTRPPSG